MTLLGTETGTRLDYKGVSAPMRPPTGQRRLGTLTGDERAHPAHRGITRAGPFGTVSPMSYVPGLILLPTFLAAHTSS